MILLSMDTVVLITITGEEVSLITEILRRFQIELGLLGISLPINKRRNDNVHPFLG